MTNPHDGSYTIVHDPGAGQPRFAGNGYTWAPGGPVDSHDGGYDIISPLGGHVDGPVADNIVTDAAGPGHDFDAS